MEKLHIYKKVTLLRGVAKRKKNLQILGHLLGTALSSYHIFIKCKNVHWIHVLELPGAQLSYTAAVWSQDNDKTSSSGDFTL